MWRFVADKISQILKTKILGIIWKSKGNSMLEVPQGDQIQKYLQNTMCAGTSVFLTKNTPFPQRMKSHFFKNNSKIKIWNFERAQLPYYSS